MNKYLIYYTGTLENGACLNNTTFIESLDVINNPLSLKRIEEKILQELNGMGGELKKVKILAFSKF